MAQNVLDTQINWSDMEEVICLVELYIDIYNNKCSKTTYNRIVARARREHYNGTVLDFLRYKLYPNYMSAINCTHGRHRVGGDSPAYFIWDYEDEDEFFEDMVNDRERRDAYKSIIKIMSKYGTNVRQWYTPTIFNTI